MRLAAVAAALLADRDRGVSRSAPASGANGTAPSSAGARLTSHERDRWRDAARLDALR
jgi:hypothetical protein